VPIDIVVESYVLEELFEALGVWTKINSGIIHESLGPEPPARARTAPPPWPAAITSKPSTRSTSATESRDNQAAPCHGLRRDEAPIRTTYARKKLQWLTRKSCSTPSAT
jgi:hypothetical protein